MKSSSPLCSLSALLVRGLGKRVGFLPKMPRLRVIHTFIWYLLYGHTQKHDTAPPSADSQETPPGQDVASSPVEEAEAPKEERERSDLKGERSSI